jgi:hypothetical protein
MKVGYRKNEWLCVYADDCGDTQIMPFDTFEQALEYSKVCFNLYGIMTTQYYDAHIEKVITKYEI